MKFLLVLAVLLALASSIRIDLEKIKASNNVEDSGAVKVKTIEKIIEGNVDLSKKPRNPGKPLDDDDFLLGSQLPTKFPNDTTLMMMKMMAEGELKGQQYEDDDRTTRFVQAKKIYHWPNGMIPYVIDASFSIQERAVIAQGMRHIEDNSCIRFVPRNGDYDFVEIWEGEGGCYANALYYPGVGQREVGLEIAQGCVSMYVVVHELLHILGVSHEQCRADRDQFVTIDWSNIKAGVGPAQYYKDTWVGTDPSVLPGLCTDTLDYTNCWSGVFATACDLPYDYASVMHYSTRAFAIDTSKDVMTAKDPSVTFLGNTELSSGDIEKLQCVYDCEDTGFSLCGGHFYGSSGTISGSCCCGGKWVLRTEIGKGISLLFSAFDVPGNCETEYFEVRLGIDKSGSLIGKFCNENPPPAKLNTKAGSVWAQFVKTEGSDSSFAATWEGETLTCCSNVMVENVDPFQTSRIGLFSAMSDGTTKNGAPVYETESGQQLWFNGLSGWIIGLDHTNGVGGLMTPDGTFCPEDATTWKYYDGSSFTEDVNAQVRCSNCMKYPEKFECETCCDTIVMENFDGQNSRQGSFSRLTDGSMYNGFPVYQVSNGQKLWNDIGYGWKVSSEPGTPYGIASTGFAWCPESATGWAYWDGSASAMINDEDARGRCSNCISSPAYDECLSCCPSLTLSNTDSAFLNSGYAGLIGSFETYTTTPILNDHVVYQLESSATYCMYYAGLAWYIYLCADIGTESGYLYSEITSKACLHNLDWTTGSGLAISLTMSCSSSCASDPPTAPLGTTSDWGGDKAGETIVTYSCPDGGPSARAVCDAVTSVWLPTAIDQSLCTAPVPVPAPIPMPVPAPIPVSVPAPIPVPVPAPMPVTVPAPMPVPVPAPMPSTTTIITTTTTTTTTSTITTPSPDCSMKNKTTELKNLLTKKRVANQIECQALCAAYTGCTHFIWKWSRRVKKRTCWLQAVVFVTKKNYKAGPVSC